MPKPGPKFTVARKSPLRGRRKKVDTGELLSREYTLVDPWDEEEALRQLLG